MFLIMKLMMTIFIVLMFLMKIIIPIINMHKKMNREKMSPFECGFDPLSKSRISFSIQFFTIALMFLIFDIEISILLPLPLSMKIISYKMMMMTNIMLMSALILGVLIEWSEGSMNWK